MILKVGLEAEFLPLNKEKNVVDCKKLNIPHDNFFCLAEVRGKPGTDAESTYSHFMYEFAVVKRMCENNGLTPSFEEYNWPNPQSYFYFLNQSDKKEETKPPNIYGLPLKPYQPIRGGGLHIHFSAHVSGLPESRETTLLYYPLIESIVKSLDAEYKSNIVNCQGRYRVPGMWEAKPWGFEYRSLPFNQWAIDNLLSITETSYKILKNNLTI